MSKDHERILLDDKVLVRKTFVELVTIFIDDIAERYNTTGFRPIWSDSRLQCNIVKAWVR